MSRILVAYFSRKGENYWNGNIKNIAKGNTEVVAEMIGTMTGGELFQVETVKPYAEDYHACVKEAVSELRVNARPELKRYLDTLHDYDTIILGFPNWCGTMPMAMFTFLEHYDWAGKRILPFCTNEGSGMGNSERDIQKICKGAEVESGLSIHGAEAADSHDRVEAWLSPWKTT